jgi:hypothetical protein
MLKLVLESDVTRPLAAEVLSFILGGRVADPVTRAHLLRAELVAVPKRDGGVRPVGLGDGWLRLASMLLTEHLKHEVGLDRVFHRGMQYAFGEASGCEAAIATVQDHLERCMEDPEVIALSLDMTAAFNETGRAFIAAALAANADLGIARRYFAMAYGESTPLLLYGNDGELLRVWEAARAHVKAMLCLLLLFR